MARIVDPGGYEVSALRRVVDFSGSDVIDLGCGDGRTTRTIARSAASVLGVDPDAEAIDRARRQTLERAIFEVADAVTLARPPGCVDAAVFSRSL